MPKEKKEKPPKPEELIERLFSQLEELREEMKADKEETSKEIEEIKRRGEEVKETVEKNKEEQGTHEKKLNVFLVYTNILYLILLQFLVFSHVCCAGAKVEELRVEMKEEQSSVVGLCTGLRDDIGIAP